jgi:tetratricopeptide (TPR) repeat protein
MALSYLDQPLEAERQLRSAVELDPKLLISKINLASVLLELQKPDEAIKWSEEALRTDASSVLAHAIRGQAYVVKHQMLTTDSKDAGLLRAAKKSLEFALSAYPPDSEQGRELKLDLDYVIRQLGY